MRCGNCGSRPLEVAAVAAWRRPLVDSKQNVRVTGRPSPRLSGEIRVVPLLVPIGRLARFQPLEAAGHDLREASGAGAAAVEATDQPSVHEHLVVLAEALQPLSSRPPRATPPRAGEADASQARERTAGSRCTPR